MTYLKSVTLHWVTRLPSLLDVFFCSFVWDFSQLTTTSRKFWSNRSLLQFQPCVRLVDLLSDLMSLPFLTAVSLLMVLVDPILRLACFNKYHHVAEVCLRLMTTGGHVTDSLDLFNCLLTEMSNQSIS